MFTSISQLPTDYARIARTNARLAGEKSTCIAYTPTSHPQKKRPEQPAAETQKPALPKLAPLKPVA